MGHLSRDELDEPVDGGQVEQVQLDNGQPVLPGGEVRLGRVGSVRVAWVRNVGNKQ